MSVDWESFEAFYAHEPLLRRVALRIVRNEETARDVVQEAFVVALTHADRVREPRRWLVRVTRNLALLSVRRRSRRARREERVARPSGSESAVHDVLARSETQWRVFRAMQSLDALDRSLLFFRYAEHKNYLEISEMFDMPPEAARSRVRRAVKVLQGAVRTRVENNRDSWLPDQRPGFESPDPRFFSVVPQS